MRRDADEENAADGKSPRGHVSKSRSVILADNNKSRALDARGVA